MYVGRIVIVGRSRGRSFVAYRVSSRSFPNRRAEVRGQSILVSPLDSADLARNPYIAYNCIRAAGDFAVVSNGTHTDMIFERIQDGQQPLDAMVLSLAAYGYERDELDTPRIAGVVRADHAWLGIARKDELRVKQFDLLEDRSLLVATYEKTDFEAIALGAESAGQAAKAAFDLPLERPVCAAAAFAEPANVVGSGFELDVFNPR
ncbi:MAG: IMP cyclohydrolase [Methanosaeta sp. PtaU1.Bin112]|nr:MAG: IMP cyclohydrolase [Methanosaeta sp. PtaU1.Bin112]